MAELPCLDLVPLDAPVAHSKVFGGNKLNNALAGDSRLAWCAGYGILYNIPGLTAYGSYPMVVSPHWEYGVLLDSDQKPL